MLKYLNIKNSNCKYKATKLEDIVNSDNNFSLYTKFIMLIEQYLLSYYLWDISHHTNNQYEEYLTKTKRLFLALELNHYKEISNDSTLQLYFDTCKKFMIGGNYSKIVLRDLFQDKRYFPLSSRMIPDNFYIPYLQTITNYTSTKDNSKYYNPILLLPYIQEKNNGNVLIGFRTKQFLDYNNSYCPTLSRLNSTYSHICKLNWTGKTWKHVYDTIQSYGIMSCRSDGSLPSVLKQALHNETQPNLINYNKPKKEFLNLLNTINSLYTLTNTSFESLNIILTNLGYEDLQYLCDSNCSLEEFNKFKSHRELQFLLPNLERSYGMEDVNTELSEENENTPTEEDPTISNDNITPDSTDTEESSDFSDTADIVEEDDPISVALKIIDDETFLEYMKREQLISIMIKIIASPPKYMSASNLKFLKIWVTEWASSVDVETSREILSKLIKRNVQLQ